MAEATAVAARLVASSSSAPRDLEAGHVLLLEHAFLPARRVAAPVPRRGPTVVLRAAYPGSVGLLGRDVAAGGQPGNQVRPSVRTCSSCVVAGQRRYGPPFALGALVAGAVEVATCLALASCSARATGALNQVALTPQLQLLVYAQDANEQTRVACVRLLGFELEVARDLDVACVLSGVLAYAVDALETVP